MRKALCLLTLGAAALMLVAPEAEARSWSPVNDIDVHADVYVGFGVGYPRRRYVRRSYRSYRPHYVRRTVVYEQPTYVAPSYSYSYPSYSYSYPRYSYSYPRYSYRYSRPYYYRPSVSIGFSTGRSYYRGYRGYSGYRGYRPRNRRVVGSRR